MTAGPIVRRVVVVVLLALVGIRPGIAQQAQSKDSTAVAAVRSAFHLALAAGDSSAVLRLLSPTVRILESGGVETLAEYRSQHLPADIAYAKAVKSTLGALSVTVVGDVAWLVASSSTTGEFNGRPVNSITVESMVLRRPARASDGWLIESIHWSSRRKAN